MEKKPNTARIPKGKKRIMITLELEVIDKIEEVAEKKHENCFKWNSYVN